MFATVEKEPSKQLFKAVSGDSCFYIPASVLAAERLGQGDGLDEEGYCRLRRLCEIQRCKEKGLVLLGIREHSAHELRQKLLGRRFAAGVVEEALKVLEAEGALSERRFCEELVRSRLSRRPLGRLAMEAILARKGADRETARAVLDEVYTPENAAELKKRAAERMRARTSDPAKLASELEKSGFGSLDF